MQHFEIYFKWILNNKKLNVIPLEESYYNQLINFKSNNLAFKEVNESLKLYLTQLNYIKDVSEENLRSFIENFIIFPVKDRKKNLLTLFEDNYFDLPEHSNISKIHFMDLMKKCDLT